MIFFSKKKNKDDGFYPFSGFKVSLPRALYHMAAHGIRWNLSEIHITKVIRITALGSEMIHLAS